MTAAGHILTKLQEELKDSPVMSNVAFGFIMAIVERMLEVEFACPCNPFWNSVFVSPFFLIPAFTFSGLMLLLHGCSGYKNVLCSLLPLVVWLALMLLDGQYVVCAKTDWPGTFVSTEDTYLKWCKPTNQTPSVEEELMNRSHRFYILSQGCGNAIVAFILVLLIVYLGCTRCNQEEEKPEQDAEEGQELQAF